MRPFVVLAHESKHSTAFHNLFLEYPKIETWASSFLYPILISINSFNILYKLTSQCKICVGVQLKQTMFIMKKTILLSFFVLILFEMQAQDNHFGLKGGWNISTISDLPSDWEDIDLDPNHSFHIGAFAEFGFSENWALVGEALFSGKGSLISIQDSAIMVDESTIKLNYLTFPVLLQYRLGPIALQAGPEFGFQIDRDVDGDVKIGILDPDFWDQKFDLSMLGGATMNFGNVFVGARYGISLSKLAEVTIVDHTGMNERKGTYGKNSFWQFSIGLRLI
jgi:hypothetical protein